MITPAKYEGAPVVRVTDIHENTDQEIIHITVDRLRLILVQHKDGFEQKKSWHTPLGVFLAVILAFLTSTFKETWGVKADVWNAFFLFVLVATIAWLLWTICLAFRSPSIENIVAKMKKHE